jgi:uncharacterized membrane protein YkvA (DUF1232 family)
MKERVRALKAELATCPWWVKAVVGLGILYLLSPIDLIPDFIPVIGQMDDVLLLGALISLVRKYSERNRSTL